MRNFRGVVWRPRRTCRHGTTATGQTPEGETSIFERMVRPKVPKVQAHSEESLELFSKLASPEDVPRQFVAAAQSGVKDFQAWQALSRTAVQSLRHFKVSHIGSILQSCAQMHWRDEHLLCGLTEAFRCACELRRGSVRDYSVILQALRRLNYCPWVGALRPIIADLRWRLRKHRWRPLDLVLALRFVAGFQVQHLPQVRAEGLALCRELRIRAEQRMGEMRHLELAHFARALVVLNQSGLPDSLLLERLADNFSRRAGELPLGALLHMCSTLLTAKADAPSEFRAVLVEKAQAELAYLKPFQIALLASTAAHFRLRDPKLLIRLGQSVGSNLDTFNLHQVGMVAEAFAVVGHHHRSLVGYIEQILLKESNSDAGLSRPKLLATFVIAAAQQENFAQRSQHLADFVQELTMALENYEAPIDELPTRPRSLPRKSRRRVSANSLLQAPIPPTPEQPTESDVPRGRKSRQKMNSEENFASESILREAPELSSRLQNLPSMPIATQQLADLEAIAFSLGTAGQTSETAPMETSVEAPAAAMGGEIIPGVGFVSGRARRSFNKTALEVNSFAPSGSSVIRAGLRRFPPRSTRNIQQILGARHPANIRLLRRLKRLEKKMELLGATSMPFTETRRRKRTWYAAAAPGTRQKGPSQNTIDLMEQKAQLWRRLRRYRLGGFEAHLVQGSFARGETSSPSSQAANSPVLSLDQSVALAAALQMAPHIPGRMALLQQLGDHGAKIAGQMKSLEQQRCLVATSCLSSTLASMHLPSPKMLETLEALSERPLEARASPRIRPRSFLSYLRLSLAGKESGVSEISEQSQQAINRQLKELLQLRDGRVLLWSLPAEELADVMSTLATLLVDAEMLDPQLRARLRRGLQEGLQSLEVEANGRALPKGWQRPLEKRSGGPPAARQFLELLAGMLWLEPCEAEVHQACVQLGISAQKVLERVSSWRGKESCQVLMKRDHQRGGNCSFPDKAEMEK